MTSEKSAGRSWWLGLGMVASLGAAVGCGGGSSAPLGAKSAESSSGPIPSMGFPQPGADGMAPVQEPSAQQPSPSPEASPAAPPRESAKKDSEDRRAGESRPGLGTEWGETRFSRITTTPFQRADASTPFATHAAFYNDRQGARAMAAGATMAPQRGIEVGDGIVTFGLKDGDSGRFLDGFESSGRDYVVGEAGQRYVIVVKNHSPMRIEVVVSVDGLDVIDGKPASFGKRGYLVDGNGTLEIDGFRQSEEAVAAFRFGSVRDSYANQKSGEARNVGVIGVALFHEQGTAPNVWREEARRRHGADPFPGRFATPPPNR